MESLFFRKSIELAKQSLENGCFPVGAVLVSNSVIIGQGRNSMAGKKNRLNHAEINAFLSSELDVCSNNVVLYTTMEPCFMCMGAAIINKIDEIVWLIDDNWAGGKLILESKSNYFVKNKIRYRKFKDEKLTNEAINLLKTHLLPENKDLFDRIMTK